jgi:hypothetical protein
MCKTCQVKELRCPICMATGLLHHTANRMGIFCERCHCVSGYAEAEIK